MTPQIVLRAKAGQSPQRSYVFTTPTECTIGRSVNCTLQVPAPEVSRHHCVLEIDPPVLRVRDLASRNGTFVNGKMIGRGDLPPAIELHAGDQLQIGTTIFEVDIAAAPHGEP